MVSDPVLRWVLTLAFAAAALYAGIRLLADRRPAPVIGNALHLAMGIAMVVMCWPWWAVLPALPQTLVFAIGAGWFLVLAVLPRRRQDWLGAPGGHARWHAFAHATMMLAMVWMVATMSWGMDADMDMGVDAGMSSAHGGLATWAALSGVVVTAALLSFGAAFLVELVWRLRRGAGRTGHAGDVAAGVVMALGTAAMCWPMIVG